MGDNKAGKLEARMREVTMGLQASQICQLRPLWHARLIGFFWLAAICLLHVRSAACRQLLCRPAGPCRPGSGTASCLLSPVASKIWQASRPNPLETSTLPHTDSCRKAVLPTQNAVTSMVARNSWTLAWQLFVPCKKWYTSSRQLAGNLQSVPLPCSRRGARAGRRQASPAPQRATTWASSWSAGDAQQPRKQRVA